MGIMPSNVQLCTSHRSQTRGKKIPQHRHCSTGLLWKPQMMSSEWSYLRVSLYCSGEKHVSVDYSDWGLSPSPHFIPSYLCFVYTTVSNNSALRKFHRST